MSCVHVVIFRQSSDVGTRWGSRVRCLDSNVTMRILESFLNRSGEAILGLGDFSSDLEDPQHAGLQSANRSDNGEHFPAKPFPPAGHPAPASAASYSNRC